MFVYLPHSHREHRINNPNLKLQKIFRVTICSPSSRRDFESIKQANEEKVWRRVPDTLFLKLNQWFQICRSLSWGRKGFQHHRNDVFHTSNRFCSIHWRGHCKWKERTCEIRCNKKLCYNCETILELLTELCSALYEVWKLKSFCEILPPLSTVNRT